MDDGLAEGGLFFLIETESAQKYFSNSINKPPLQDDNIFKQNLTALMEARRIQNFIHHATDSREVIHNFINFDNFSSQIL